MGAIYILVSGVGAISYCSYCFLIFDVPAMAVFQDGSLFQPQMSARAAKMALDNVVKRTGSGLGPIKLGEGPRYGCTFQ